ncbi:hypothetical protein BS17DRAFT_716793, partial [Gyrodon lividus]
FLYLVKWVGYKGTDEENSWIFVTELGHAFKLVSDFNSSYPMKPGLIEMTALWNPHPHPDSAHPLWPWPLPLPCCPRSPLPGSPGSSASCASGLFILSGK